MIDLGPPRTPGPSASLWTATSSTPREPVDAGGPAPCDRTRALREWARANGYEIADRAHITDIVAAYRDAT